MILVVAVCVFAYALGSLQFGVILSACLGYGDPRKAGSGNTGATNVARNSGTKMGVLVLLADMLKGLLPVLLARYLSFDDFSTALVGLFAVIGHMYPLFYRFKGGKGVATALGVVIALCWPSALLGFAVMLLVVTITRYVSLGSILASVAVAIAISVTHQQEVYPITVMTALIIWRHRANIERLLRGVENKFR